MRKILVCQHVGYEILGTLNPLFKEHGFRIRYVNFGRFPEMTPGVAGYDGMILLGGPMNVDQMEKYPHLAHEIRMIEEGLQREIPILGICLGAQLIAKALGAEVGRNREKEIGWYDLSLTPEGKTDPVFQHFHNPEKVFQWHGDTFTIPRGAVCLATSSTCANQAFRYGDKVYGLQFHLEVDQPMIERWLQVPNHQREMEGLVGKIVPEKIQEETGCHIGRLEDLSEKTFTEFIKLFGVQKKYRLLPSR
jgi:GMP synthase (glutamine-hydrolysing)